MLPGNWSIILAILSDIKAHWSDNESTQSVIQADQSAVFHYI